ncbi:MAG: hypothetical protein Q9225_001007 [Loekoesia sp. 1 TL-2023]
MSRLGASKVSLSLLSSPDLWKKSGRYKDDHPELFQLEDRKGSKFLLSPTHEEEITALVSGSVHSHKQLPLLVYQTSRKYRDEPRPRQGLLRTREFLMKDLYTFDVTQEKALVTYRKVRKAYDNIFNELQVRFVVARAASGEIGGSLSHEYHIPTTSGEDIFIRCGSCTYAANEEWVPENAKTEGVERSTEDWSPYQSWFGVSRDRRHLVEAVLPQKIRSAEHLSPKQMEGQVNPHLIKSLYLDLDLSIEQPLRAFVEYWKEKQRSGSSIGSKVLSQPHLTRIYDYRVSQGFIEHHGAAASEDSVSERLLEIVGPTVSISQKCSDLARVEDGDECPACRKKDLKVLRTLELGHTFHLGQRYSKPMNATFATQPNEQMNDGALAQQDLDQSTSLKSGQAWFHMGCHGIGISRMIAAVADSLADEKGLIWPRIMAPYEAVILATEEHKAVAEEIWDTLTQHQEGTNSVEAVIDDRDRSFGWKLKDADLIGFPIVIILGSTFSKQGLCEVSIRRLGLREKVTMENLKGFIASRLAEI